MDKGLFFLIMSMVCLYLLLDEFVGQGRITKVAGLMTPDLSFSTAVKDKISEAATKADELAPNVFYDPNNPEDKAKPTIVDGVKDYIEQNAPNPNKVY